MGRISDKIRHLLARQVRGIVVWYDSEKAYGYFVKRLSLSKQQFSHPRTALSPEREARTAHVGLHGLTTSELGALSSAKEESGKSWSLSAKRRQDNPPHRHVSFLFQYEL